MIDDDLWHPNLVQWRSRRGTLELDLIFMPFYQSCYQQLSSRQRLMHQWFLLQKEQYLQSWFLFRNKVEQLTPEQRDWIDVVLSCNVPLDG